MAGTTVHAPRDTERLSALLDSPEITDLIARLDATRWTGRPGYPTRALVGMCLVKALYAIPTWTRVARLVADHAGIQACLECAPSQWACYRFATKLREHSAVLADCLAAVLDALRTELPGMGGHVAIDGSDLPAYANGHRYLRKDGPLRERYSDPDASWGHRSAVSTRTGGGYYGYKLHAAVCTTTGLPLAWRVETARDHEMPQVAPLLDAVKLRGFSPEYAMLDKGYDGRLIYEACAQRGIRPIIPLRKNSRGEQPVAVPSCEHGDWTFAGADDKRGAAKWRCPSGECTPASRWIKADRVHTLVPRDSKRWRALYRERGAVEREFGRLKHEWALLPLRVRGIAKARLHADLSILGQLAVGLDKARSAQVVHGSLAA
jgi:hypothetical protein